MPKLLSQVTAALATQSVMFVVLPTTAQAATFRLQEATIADINLAFDSSALTSKELTQLYLNRIEAYDNSGPSINAIRTLNPRALEVAARLDRERLLEGPRSPLHGIPILLKDNFDTFDLPTTGGSEALAGSIPPNDAFVVKKLREAGAIILGKAEMDEFAISGSGYSSLGGQTLNPYQLNRQSGGSSGGPGAAIAANFATVGTGSDTGGSIRTPSSFQGLVGVRPTRGLISLDGIIPFTLSRDMIGPMARTVTDAAITLGAMVEFDPDNPGTRTLIPPPALELDKFYTDYTQFLDPDDLEGARLGVVRNYFGNGVNGVDPEVNQLAKAALKTMRGQGATTVNVKFDDDFLTSVSDTYETATLAEQEPYLENYLATLGPDYPKTIEGVIAALESPEVANSETPSAIIDVLTSSAQGSLNDPAYIDVAKNVTPSIRSTLIKTLERKNLDAFVFPTIGTFARPLPDVIDPTFVSPEGAPPARQVELASATGLADVTVPIGFSDGGLPLTMSFTGRPYSESTLLGLAYSYEQATQFSRPSPLVPALPGEVFKYEPVPEPSSVLGTAVLGLAALGLKLKRRQNKDKFKAKGFSLVKKTALKDHRVLLSARL